MHFRCPPGMPARTQVPETNYVPSDLANAGAAGAPEVAAPRPFVERRRSRRIEQSWTEALDQLQRLLLGFENANKQLTESETKYRTLFEDAPVGMFQVDRQGRPLSLNSAMSRVFGYESPDEFLAAASKEEIRTLFDPSQWNARESSIGEADLRRFDLQVTSRDGEGKWVRFHVRAIREHGRIVRYEGTGEDISERKRIESRTERLAYYDLLTDLPNRTLFHERYSKALASARRKHGQVALILLSLDRFKVINDSLGENFGDRLLQEIAERMIELAGPNNIVARIGGAEFAIVLKNVEDLSSVTTIAQSLVAKLSTEYSFFGHSLNVFCNLGISIFPENGKDCETLMKAADIALSCSREDGLNSFRIFTNGMNDKIQESLLLEQGLRTALARNELFLVYQPQVDMRTGHVTGLEALLRWNHPQSGLLLPGKFIEVAETSGLIVPIGEWVLRTACAQARKWQDEGLPPVPVAVNVSPVQFRQQGFRELVQNILDETGLDPKYLELELTESLLLSSADFMFSLIQELKDMGIMLAIDDFGTGFSSLGYLRQFKVNRLKIARSFIQDVSDDTDDAAITTAIINMAKALNLSVLAEGVETAAQLSFLQEQQCYTIQGFYFSRPVAVDQIDRQLRVGFPHMSASPFCEPA
ncbi:MAG: putative bifunctional diguanylate cyclase/phosphodiesterase [Terracidiphilus sp.]